MSTGSELFSPLICLEATKFELLSVFTLKETICPRICSKTLPRGAKSPLPVDVRRSKTSLLKLTIELLNELDSRDNDGDGYENVTKKMNSLIPARSIRQMLAIFSGAESYKTVSKFRKRKRKSLSCVHVLDKTSN